MNKLSNRFFSQRLNNLRVEKNVSAREMSLALGQNESYINRIENGINYPSMQVFFNICEYFGITPEDFFNLNRDYPAKLNSIFEDLEKLDDTQLEIVSGVVRGLLKK